MLQVTYNIFNILYIHLTSTFTMFDYLIWTLSLRFFLFLFFLFLEKMFVFIFFLPETSNPGICHQLEYLSSIRNSCINILGVPSHMIANSLTYSLVLPTYLVVHVMHMMGGFYSAYSSIFYTFGRRVVL